MTSVEIKTQAPVTDLHVSAHTIPTDSPESDGTMAWDKTTIAIVEAEADGERGLGYTYGPTAAAHLISEKLKDVVVGRDALAVPEIWEAMVHAVRNIGRPGVAAMAIAAVDHALWDLKARISGQALVTLLGPVRSSVPIYGSGGFTSYTDKKLQQQLAGWIEAGIPRVKMKVGSQPERDLTRVQAARHAIGPRAQLFVDANGAYSRKQALQFAEEFARAANVSWFEEPVSSDDLEGLRLLRDRAPAGMDIAAGEYGYDLFYFRRMLEAEAVDVLQADTTRCGGTSGFLRAGTLCQARCLHLSGHTAPMMHVHAACACPAVCHLEYFHDHVRIEHMLFDGVLEPVDGALTPDRSRPGNGLELKQADAEKYLVWRAPEE